MNSPTSGQWLEVWPLSGLPEPTTTFEELRHGFFKVRKRLLQASVRELAGNGEASFNIIQTHYGIAKAEKRALQGLGIREYTLPEIVVTPPLPEIVVTPPSPDGEISWEEALVDRHKLFRRLKLSILRRRTVGP